MMTPRPMSTRKTVQLMVALTLLAWATQTLFAQWGLGGLILPSMPAQRSPSTRPAEMAADPASEAAPADRQPETAHQPPRELAIDPLEQPPMLVLELRSEIRPQAGTPIFLRDLCRWSDADAAAIEPHADLVLAIASDAPGVTRLAVNDIRSALHDAGMNLSAVRFSGAAACAVAVGDVTVADIRDAIAADTDASAGASNAASPSDAASPANAAAPLAADGPQTPLRELLVGPLVRALALTPETVQVDFNPKDQALLALESPRCTFTIDDTGAVDLGPVAWDITIRDDAGERIVTLHATARAWEDQLVVTRPLSRGQPIRSADLAARRTLVDARQACPLTDPAEAVGMLAANDLKPGSLITAQDLAEPALVSAGDFINVSMRIGGTTVATVARAMETGPRGAVIQARNQATRDVYRVVVTGVSAGDVISD